MNTTQVKPLSFFALKSTGFHVLIVLFACFTSWFSWQAGEKQRKINIKLVQSSVRVDMVALPEKTLKELEAIQASSTTKAAAPAAPIAKPAKAPVEDKGNEFLKNKKKSKKSLADLLKNYSDKKKPIKRAKSKAKGEEGLSKKQQALLAGLVKRGNKVQKGEALVGSGSAENLSAVQSYASKLPGIVKPFWKIPSYLADRGLQARIRVFINPQGRVIRATVYESSGDEEYDNRALQAVKRASPFPQPEGQIKKNILNGDILLGFPL